MGSINQQIAGPQVEIQGPVLLLMGPIGLFFARFWAYLQACGVPAYKIAFPLHEFGFPARARIPYSGSMEQWPDFLRGVIREKGIKHIFMYGDFIDPHRLAIEEARRAGIDAQVFELGYLRPNFVTLEPERVNSRSNLNKPLSFYRSLPPVAKLPVTQLDPGWRWRKLWKAPTFIQHAFTRYRIIDGEHKLQPSPGFLWCQLRGSWRFWMYRIQERRIKRLLLENLSYFLVVLQVSSDSQITLGSPYQGMNDFIEQVIVSFAAHAHPSDHLAFKHHPRDRGYNNYLSLIRFLAEREGIGGRVHYFHDGALSRFLRVSRGVVTVNSTVGLQALFHAAPTKVMGHTFYNLPGLTDQQDLDGFWQAPQPSSRPLFYRFYHYLLTTTQINGNFDGDFPFRKTFPIAPAARAMPADPPRVGQRPRAVMAWPVVGARVMVRTVWVVLTFVVYGLQLVALALGACPLARWLLALGAGCALRALGIEVIADHPRERTHDDRAAVHIYNHASPFDVLAIQASLRIPSITTSTLHLSRLFPFFERSAANAGHVLLDHRQAASRRRSLWQASQLLRSFHQILLAPNGSLVTPITRRASPSALVLARRHGAVIIPWWFDYRGMGEPPANTLYDPLALLRWRLSAPRATLRIRRGRPDDLPFAPECNDRQAFSQAVIDFYTVDSGNGLAELAGTADGDGAVLNRPPASPG
ncbi:MAG: 1-acyl-sn-glycerol-3-phosphate acyltransferase [Cyanobacteriota bacterium]|nr:1-acyl-sn-glycerol-3-phosphate acyltransferase [Cyanobacteriota bacterium]